MCGRVTLHTSPDGIASVFDAAPASGLGDFEPHWNVGPTSDLLGLTIADDAPPPESTPLVLDRYRWGLIPWWAKDPSEGNRRINARAETVATAPSFRDPFRRRRTAIVVDGFLEWRRGPGKQRQPYYFHRADGKPLAFAGLWEAWGDRSQEPAGESRARSCTIITTTASTDMNGIHNRMPVVLESEALEVWLDAAGTDPDELTTVLRPAPVGTLAHHPVGPRVGNVRNDAPDLIAPIDPDTTERPGPLQPSLFPDASSEA